MRPAVFLDRDGTINEKMGYINHISRFHLLPGVAEAIRLLNQSEIPVVIVTNQSGLARGYIPEELLTEVHDKMVRLLSEDDAHVDGIYICPHHPEAVMPEHRIDCDCRKPKTGLLDKAANELGLDLPKSYVVGDRWSDLKAAVKVGSTPVLVLTGYGKGDLEYTSPGQEIQPRYIANDLYEAVEWILSDLDSSNV